MKMAAILYLPDGTKKEVEVSDPPKKYLRIPFAPPGTGLLNPPEVDENGTPIFSRLRLRLAGIVDGKAIYM